MNSPLPTNPTSDPLEDVLVVDDDPIVCEMVAQWLASERILAVTVESVRAARRELGERNFAVIVTDICMPDETGLQLLDYLRQIRCESQVVVATGRSDADTAIQALTRGAHGYLIKPFERAELIKHVRRAMAQHQLVVEHRRYTQQLEQLVREQTAHVRMAHEETIHRLVTASLMRDEETGAHIRRTGLFSEALARAAGWSEDRVEAIRLAAPMHDVGKIGIPDEILRKPGPLNAREFDVMKRHTEIGARMLAGSNWPVLELAHEIALCHHERWDGYGYPRGLSGLEIPESARIVMIADVYDALTHDRIYRPALPRHEALAMFESERGRQFEPRLLDLFLSILPTIEQISAENPDELVVQAPFADSGLWNPTSLPPCALGVR